MSASRRRPRDAVAPFAAAGHDVQTVLDEALGGKPDRDVIEVARAEDRIVVTLDVDFADIREYPPSEFPGIWVLRSRSQAVESVLALLRGAIAVGSRPAPNNGMELTGKTTIRSGVSF